MISACLFATERQLSQLTPGFFAKGCDIKKDLREQYDGVLFQEPARPGGVDSEFYTKAGARIYDCMLELYYRPPHCNRGAHLVDWFFRTRVLPGVERGQIVVLIFDNQLRTPRCKAACQAKRRTRMRQLPTDLVFGDDCYLPEDWYGLMATTKLRTRMFQYLLTSLQKRIDVALPHELCGGSAVFVSLPYLQNVDGTCNPLATGEAIELTNTQRIPLPRPAHGEGDLLCKVWVEHLVEHAGSHLGEILVKTKDWDTVCAFLTSAPPCRVCVHVGDKKGKTSRERKQLEFVDIQKFWTDVLKSNRNLALSWVLGNILSGSDYCEGVFGVSGKALLRKLLPMSEEAYPVSVGERGQLVVNKKRLGRWIQSSKRGRGGLRNQPRMLRRAFWNLTYWYNLNAIPDPLVYGGWEFHDNGVLLPIVDISS